MKRKRSQMLLILFCFLLCLFSTRWGSFDGIQEVAAAPIRSCIDVSKVTGTVRAGMTRGSINPITGLCGGIEMVECDGGF
jgi:hypothetical protein